MVVNLGFIGLLQVSDTLLALSGLPHYFSMFIWGPRSADSRWWWCTCAGRRRPGGTVAVPQQAGVALAAVVGVALTLGAIWGSFYKVTSPTLLAPWFAVGWLVIGLIVTLLVKGRPPASEVLDELHSEAG